MSAMVHSAEVEHQNEAPRNFYIQSVAFRLEMAADRVERLCKEEARQNGLSVESVLYAPSQDLREDAREILREALLNARQTLEKMKGVDISTTKLRRKCLHYLKFARSRISSPRSAIKNVRGAADNIQSAKENHR